MTIFTDLGDLAYKKFREGGNLVTYCGTGFLVLSTTSILENTIV